MKQAVIVHAWDEGPNSCWYQWLKGKLAEQGYEVIIPSMPDATAPQIEPWVAALRGALPNPDSETLLVGHSIGCQTILRYLATLDSDVRVGKVVFVAPWTHLQNLSEASQTIARPWLEAPISWEATKSHCPDVSAFFSDDDEWVPLAEARVFRDNLAAKTHTVRGMGHFDKITEFPGILNV